MPDFVDCVAVSTASMSGHLTKLERVYGFVSKARPFRKIDLVCENETDGTLDFREVKTDPRRIDLQALGLKVAAFFRKNPDLRRERFGVGGLSLKDM